MEVSRKNACNVRGVKGVERVTADREGLQQVCAHCVFAKGGTVMSIGQV